MATLHAGTSATDGGAAPRAGRRPVAVLVLAAIVALLVSMLWTDRTVGSLDDMVWGNDSAMRLERVLQLHETGDWYDAFQTRTNAPFGERLHWTRPMDALLYPGGWIGELAGADFRTGLTVWALLVSPVLLVLAVFVLAWGTRGWLDDFGFLLAVVALGVLRALRLAFRFGRPDHHGLILLLFLVQLMVLLRLARGEAERRHVRLAGLAGALAIWVSVESLTHVVLFCGGLGVLWLWRPGEQLRDLSDYLTAMAGGAVVALGLERAPADWSTVTYERFSVVHVALVATAAVAVTVAARRWGTAARDWSVARRVALGSAVAAVPVVLMALLFPRFFEGPFAEMTNADFVVWLDQIGEYQPLLPVGRKAAVRFAEELGPAILALGFMGWRWRRSADAERAVLLLWLAGLALFVPPALGAFRWSAYVQAVVWVPFTCAAVAVLRSGRGGSTGRAAVGAFGAVAIILLPSVTGAFIALPGRGRRTAARCPVERAADALPDGRGIVLADYFDGPMIIWRTDLDVVGAPYGNPDSLRDTNTFFLADATADAAPREVASRRGLDLVLVCVDDPYYARDRDTFHDRLARGDAPPWLEEVALAPEVSDAYRLYAVRID